MKWVHVSALHARERKERKTERKLNISECADNKVAAYIKKSVVHLWQENFLSYIYEYVIELSATLYRLEAYFDF